MAKRRRKTAALTKPSTGGHGESHGLNLMKRAMKRLGSRAVDKRTRVGRALAAWQADIVANLGGHEALSAQQLAVVELVVRQKLILDSIDAFILAQPSLVNRKRKSMLPIVRERQLIADGLSRYLGQLGLERKTKDVEDAISIIRSSRERGGDE